MIRALRGRFKLALISKGLRLQQMPHHAGKVRFKLALISKGLRRLERDFLILIAGFKLALISKGLRLHVLTNTNDVVDVSSLP